MANKTVIIAEIKDSEKWINIKSNDGIEYGIYKEKSPKLVAEMATKKVGEEITGSHSVGKEGKNFLWDIDEKKSGFGGGKSFAPKDKKFDAGVESLKAAASMFALDKEKNADQVILIAEKFHAFLMSKVTAAPVEPAK